MFLILCSTWTLFFSSICLFLFHLIRYSPYQLWTQAKGALPWASLIGRPDSFIIQLCPHHQGEDSTGQVAVMPSWSPHSPSVLCSRHLGLQDTLSKQFHIDLQVFHRLFILIISWELPAPLLALAYAQELANGQLFRGALRVLWTCRLRCHTIDH